MSVSITSISSQPNSSLSVYEQERQKNIEKNKAVLAELGLGDARKQLIETHKKDVVEKIKRRYTKKSFPIETPRRSARIQGKPVRYTDGFGSDDENEDGRKASSSTNNVLALTTISSPSSNNTTALSPLKRKYSFYDIEDEITTRPKYKNELTTCHFCRKRDRKPKTRCSTCGIKYWVGDCCRSCFEQHFEDEDFDEVMMNKNWVCYCCRKKCPCLECIAGITKGRRYGPRKVGVSPFTDYSNQLKQFKDAPKEDYTTTQPNFSGVVPDQFSLFSPLPLPSFLNYNNTAPSALHFPMLPQPHFAPPSSPPRSSSPTFASAPNSFSSPSFSSPNFSPFPSPSLFSPLGQGNGNNMSSYSGGFPSLHSTFGGTNVSNNNNSQGVSPQNIFGLMSPLPTLSLPPPHPSTQQPQTQQSALSHFLSAPPSFLNNYATREPEGLGNGAMCGFKMAQVIAQITNAPTPPTTGFSYLQPNFNSFSNPNSLLNTTTLASLNTNNNNSFMTSMGVGPKKKPGRKPNKGFNFAFHTSESISSDPMSNDVYDQPAGDLLPPIKIPPTKKPRGRPKNKDLPALSVEEEAMSMNMSTAEENIDGLGGDPPTPVLSPPPIEKKKRGRPKGSGPTKKIVKYARNKSTRGRKPKSYSFSSPTSPSSEIPCTPPPQSPSPSTPFGMNSDEFFNNSNDDLLYDDDMFNEMELGIIQPFGGSHPHTTLSSDDLNASGGAMTPVNEQLKVRLKVPNVYNPTSVLKKRGRKPGKKTNKIKLAKEAHEKRKYTKRKIPRDAEDTSNIRRELHLRYRIIEITLYPLF